MRTLPYGALPDGPLAHAHASPCVRCHTAPFQTGHESLQVKTGDAPVLSGGDLSRSDREPCLRSRCVGSRCVGFRGSGFVFHTQAPTAMEGWRARCATCHAAARSGPTCPGPSPSPGPGPSPSPSPSPRTLAPTLTLPLTLTLTLAPTLPLALPLTRAAVGHARVHRGHRGGDDLLLAHLHQDPLPEGRRVPRSQEAARAAQRPGHAGLLPGTAPPHPRTHARAPSMRYTCTPYALHMRCMRPAYALHRTQYALQAPCMHVACICTPNALHTHCIRTAHALHTHCPLPRCRDSSPRTALRTHASRSTFGPPSAWAASPTGLREHLQNAPKEAHHGTAGGGGSGGYRQ